MVGVGDGPWDTMEKYDDQLGGRKFDNFQFVPFHKIVKNAQRPHVAFAISALQEIPAQYLAIKQLGYFS